MVMEGEGGVGGEGENEEDRMNEESLEIVSDRVVSEVGRND
jgi:hypothetical protein